jgi:hypothetical protein
VSEEAEDVQLKEQPNRAIYIDVLRRMGPEGRLAKAFELTEMTREALRVGLAQRYPSAGPEQIQVLVRERLERCRNRNS